MSVSPRHCPGVLFQCVPIWYHFTPFYPNCPYHMRFSASIPSQLVYIVDQQSDQRKRTCMEPFFHWFVYRWPATSQMQYWNLLFSSWLQPLSLPSTREGWVHYTKRCSMSISYRFTKFFLLQSSRWAPLEIKIWAMQVSVTKQHIYNWWPPFPAIVSLSVYE